MRWTLFVAALLSALALAAPAGAAIPAPGASSGEALQEPDGDLVTIPSPVYCSLSALGGCDSRALAVTRRLADGAPDPAFGTGGTAVIDVAPGQVRAVSVALDDQGRLVVAGAYSQGGSQSLLIARFLPDGTPDPGFGSGGREIVTRAGSFADIPSAIAIQPDGKMVVAGTSIQGPAGGVAVARLDGDGNLDPGFGEAGVATIAPQPEYTASAGPIAIQADGKVVVLTVETKGIERRLSLSRLTAAGQADPSFGGGRPMTANPVTASYGQLNPRSVFLDGAGRVYAAANERTEEHCCTNGVVARFDSGGAPDPSFRGEGEQPGIGKLARSELTTASLLPDGSVFLGGSAKRGILVARLGPDGKPIPSYDAGGSGVVSVAGLTTYPLAFFPAADGSATALALPRGASCRRPGRELRWRHCLSEATVAFGGDGFLDKPFGGVGFITRPRIHVCRYLATTACGIDIGLDGLRRLAGNNAPRKAHLRGDRVAFRVRCDRRLETRCQVTTGVALGPGPRRKRVVGITAGKSRLVLLPAPPGLLRQLRSSPTGELSLSFSQRVAANGIAVRLRHETLRLLGG